MKNIILLLGISLFCYACGCDKPSNISFSQEDMQWIFYKLNQSFSYKNQKGERITYVVSTLKDTIQYQHNAQPAVIFSFCAQAYNMPVRVIILKNQTNPKDSIIMNWRKDYLPESPEKPIRVEGKFQRYDMNIQVSYLDSKFSGSFDSLKMRESNSIKYIEKEYILKRFSLVNGKSYENVYYSRKASYNVDFTYYYHKTTGIIRFETENGDIWELE